MLVTKEIEIDMAHRVCFHKSKCRNLHGHRYKIEVWVNDKIIKEYGQSDFWMVIDFSDLKQIMMEEIDERFDHWAIFFEKDPYKEKLLEMIALWDQKPEKLHFVNFVPTAENLSKYWFELLKPRLQLKGIKITHVKIYETPTSTAIYTSDEFENDKVYINNPFEF